VCCCRCRNQFPFSKKSLEPLAEAADLNSVQARSSACACELHVGARLWLVTDGRDRVRSWATILSATPNPRVMEMCAPADRPLRHGGRSTTAAAAAIPRSIGWWFWLGGRGRGWPTRRVALNRIMLKGDTTTVAFRRGHRGGMPRHVPYLAVISRPQVPICRSSLIPGPPGGANGGHLRLNFWIVIPHHPASARLDRWIGIGAVWFPAQGWAWLPRCSIFVYSGDWLLSPVRVVQAVVVWRPVSLV
jgi:hypothetical protein